MKIKKAKICTTEDTTGNITERLGTRKNMTKDNGFIPSLLTVLHHWNRRSFGTQALTWQADIKAQNLCEIRIEIQQSLLKKILQVKKIGMLQ